MVNLIEGNLEDIFSCMSCQNTELCPCIKYYFYDLTTKSVALSLILVK
uniref:Uncharacterized protein n=1 Tax=Rhizophora mucronata TaxID=61149 RepID=A0A2P2N7H4_RHIMU